MAFFSFLVSFDATESDDRTAAAKSSITSYLGCSMTDEKAVSREAFEALIDLPLCAKDTGKNHCKIQSFQITYAERGLYQDSTGLPIVVTDYSSVKCIGDTIPMAWRTIFHQRSYKGDTIYFDKIIAKTPDDKIRLCKGLKIVLR